MRPYKYLSIALCSIFLSITTASVFAATSTTVSTQAIGRESPWPLTVKSGAATLTVYQPQLDTWDGYHLIGRVAVQVTTGNPPRNSYGIVNLSAHTLTDKGTRVVTISGAQVAKSNFPSATAEQARSWANTIARDLSDKSRTIALDRFEQQLAIAGDSQMSGNKPLRHDPPHVIFSPLPAILIYIDGAPVYHNMQGTGFDRVINTRPLIVRDGNGDHYIKLLDGWMRSATLNGPWTVISSPSAALNTAFKQASAAHLIDPLTGQAASDKPTPSLKTVVPTLYVVTTPTELIVTDGAPKYAPIAGTQLLYAENTTGHIFKYIVDNRTYILVSGRWFRASNEQGPWEYVSANTLPPDFAKIPDDSAVENVKASVAGTTQAAEAAIAATIPQTAAVKISGTTLTQPRFDGSPVYKPIPETSLQYVANTSTPIISISGQSLYALQNGVWFTASSLNGPWIVATSVPPAIYTIPPSSSLYYVTFVRIYAVTDTTVYVGYTPGYQGAYIDPVTGVVVYGTGYIYDPWISTVWYGDPITYGYAASIAYTPWTGWAYGFGFGWFWGAATMAYGWGWGPYPYWGPWGYPAWGAAWGARGGAVAWGPGGWAGYSGNIYHQWGDRANVSRVAGGFNAWTGNEWAGRVGASYNSRTGIASAGQRGGVANVYSGNYAAGSRGVATGPGGNVVVGSRGTAGNANTGNQISGNRGAYYNKDTGQWTKFGGASGQQGGKVSHVGDDIYAGKDGNVYRNTGDGWEKHTSDGWQSAPGSKQGEATRNATSGLGATRSPLPEHSNSTFNSSAAAEGRATREAGGGFGSEHPQNLDRERFARQAGGQRAQQLRQSSFGMRGGFGRRR